MGINTDTIRHRLRNNKGGYKRLKSTTRVKDNRRISIDGVIYQSKSEASNTLGIPKMTILGRLRSRSKKFETYRYVNQDGTLEDKSIDTESKPKKSLRKGISVDGVVYDSLTIAEQKTGINRATLRYRSKQSTYPNIFMLQYL